MARKKKTSEDLFHVEKKPAETAAAPSAPETPTVTTSGEKVSLAEFVENPDNPQTITAEAFERLCGKIKRVPFGLKANRIAYVTDHAAGKRVVLSGNKRLRALKHVFGENYLAPVEWFQDITRMTDAERREFIIDANVNEGEWDVEKLLEQYDRDELGNLFDAGEIGDILAEITQGAAPQKVKTEETAESQAFEAKFVPKKTTDDCYTPENIFAAVLDWSAKRYGFDKAKIVRPFYPGADYKTTAYPSGYTVVDNPPFSIFSEIVAFYQERKIPFFLFGPHLTLASGSSSKYPCTFVVACAPVTYENGAIVSTSFVTNLDPDVLITVEPELHDTLKAINDANIRAGKPEIQKHEYPDCVISIAQAGRLACHHTPLVIKRSDAVYIRMLDAQKDTGDAIFGGGFLLSERAAAERAAAERAAAERAAAERAAAKRWDLSDREQILQMTLGRGEK